MRKKWQAFWKDEEGMGTLEILLIIAVLVAIAVVFRKWIVSWVNTLFDQAQTEIENRNGGTLREPNSDNG